MYICIQLTVVKDVQSYELFGGIALKNHAFSFFMFANSNTPHYYLPWYIERELVNAVNNTFVFYVYCKLLEVSM